MKTLVLLLLTICSQLICLAQVPVNDSCQNAIELIPTTTYVYVAGTTKDATPSYPSYMQGNLCGNSPTSDPNDVWYKFVAIETKYQIITLVPNASSTIQVFSGTCDNFSEMYCKHLGGNGTLLNDSLLVWPLVIGSTYYIRFVKWIPQFTPNTSSSFQVGIKTTPVVPPPTFIKSKVTGGMWHLPSTWEGGVVPGPNDTAHITDGSRVTLDNDLVNGGKVTLKCLQVGGVDSTKHARLQVVHFANIILKNDFILGRKDTVYGAKANVFFNLIYLFVKGNVVVDGVMNAWMGFEFSGTVPQYVKGKGAFYRDSCFEISNYNPTTVHFDFPVTLANRMNLVKGVLKCRYPVKFYMSMYNGVHGYQRDVVRGLGRLEGSYQVFENPAYVNKGYLIETTYSHDSSWGPDTIAHFGPELDRSKWYHQINASKQTQGRMYLDTPLRVQFISTTRCDLVMQPGDTLFAGDNRATVVGGTPCMQYYPADTVNYQCLMAKGDLGGKKRTLFMDHMVEPNVPHFLLNRNHKICMDFFGSRPQGTVLPPLQALEGTSYMKITSSGGTIPNGITFTTEPFAIDSMRSDRGRWRLAQALTPTGPWQMVSTTFVGSTNRMATEPINWSKGSYFAFATTAKPYDLKLVNLVPPPFYKGACQDGPSQPLGFVVQNLGFMPVTSAQVAYSFDNGPIHEVTSFTYPFALNILDRDTLWMNGADGLLISDPLVYPIKAWVHLVGDTSVANDTIRSTLNYSPAPMPYLQTFDTVAGRRYGWMGNYGPNLPYRWYNDSLAKKLEMRLNHRTFQVHAWADKGIWYQNGYQQPSATAQYMTNQVGSQPNPFGTVVVEPIGPVHQPAFVSFKLALGLFPPTATPFGTLDTLHLEYKESCFAEWKTLRKVHKGNWVPFAGYNKMIDSLPVAEDAIVQLRFRLDFRGAQPGGQAQMGLDSVRVFRDTALVLTAVKDRLATGSFFLYPNPGTGQAFLELGKTHRRVEVQVVSLTGQTVFAGSFADVQTVPFTVSGAKGLYLVRVKDETGRVQSLKWMKEL